MPSAPRQAADAAVTVRSVPATSCARGVPSVVAVALALVATVGAEPIPETAVRSRSPVQGATVGSRVGPPATKVASRFGGKSYLEAL